VRAILSWVDPTSVPSGTGYAIDRNGKAIGYVTSDTYTDDNAPLGTTYTYSVVTVEDNLRSAPVSIRIHLARPSLADARLNGSYTVTNKVTAQVGTWSRSHVGQVFHSWGWVFKPLCHSGPCSVHVDMKEDGTDLSGTLVRSGATYSGILPAQRAWYCTSGGPEAEVSVHLTVTSAKNDYGVWRAQAISGTLYASFPAGSPCTGSDSRSFTGRFTG
jgi:hypothetical protein